MLFIIGACVLIEPCVPRGCDGSLTLGAAHWVSRLHLDFRFSINCPALNCPVSQKVMPKYYSDTVAGKKIFLQHLLNPVTMTSSLSSVLQSRFLTSFHDMDPFP